MASTKPTQEATMNNKIRAIIATIACMILLVLITSALLYAALTVLYALIKFVLLLFNAVA